MASASGQLDLVGRFVDGANVLYGGRWTPLPAWAQCLVRVGADCAARQEPSTYALVLPTRAYAAVLCALGVVLRRLEIPVRTDAAAHLELIRGLQPGTTVTYRTRRGTTRFTGLLVGCESTSLGEFIVVQPSQGATIRVSSRCALDVVPSGTVISKLPQYAALRKVRGYSPLLGGLVSQSIARRIFVESRLECVVVGSEATLREEITGTKLRLPDAGETTDGSAQDILRARRFMSGGGSHRSDVFSKSTKRLEEARSLAPAVAILDGVTTFLRWGALWPTASRIVLLDRTDSRLGDATAELDRVYFQHRPVALDCCQYLSPGMEGIAFGVAP